MKKRIGGYFTLLKSTLYCIHLSWKSSHLYTTLCLGIRVIMPLVNLVNLFASKMILDILAATDTTCSYNVLIVCFSLVAFATIIKLVIEKVMVYADSNLTESVSKEVTTIIMNMK